MDSEEKIRPKATIHGKAYIIFILVGVLFILFSIFLFSARKASYVRTSAVITDIERVSHGDDDTYIVTVEYTVGDVTYSGELGSYFFTYHEGKQVDIFYDPDNPTEFIAADDKIMAKVFVVLGAISVIVGVSMFIKASKKRKVEQENGTSYY